MKIYINPSRTSWPQLTARPQLALEFLESSVRNIFNRVKKSGDNALRELTLQFDKVDIGNLEVSKKEVQNAENALSQSLKEAIKTAAANIEKFHDAQKKDPIKIETTPGVTCWRRAVPIEKIGIYIPGGSAPLFSTVLMLGVPARLAKCSKVVLCSPPDKSGEINPAI